MPPRAAPMELHDVHKAQIARYTAFFGTKRARALADRDCELEDFKSDRLVDEAAIFNYADVVELLNTYHQQVMGRVREELELEINQSANYIAHLMSQAEANGVYLQIEDITIIEDQSRVGQVGSLSAMAAPAMPPLLPKPRQTLESVHPGGGGGGDNVALLQELQEAKEQKRLMEERCSRVEYELTNISRERSALSAEVGRLQEASVAGVDQTHAHAQEYARQLQETRQAYEAKFAECQQLSQEMTTRLADSVQFQQLKSIVKQKTAEVKDLKGRLVAAGMAPAEEPGCVELQADSD